MALDMGSMMNLRLVDPLGDRVAPLPSNFEKIGAYLRAMREHRSLSLSELANSTRIRKSYLQGIEDADLSALPSRPFAIGYVRAYATALGIDGDAAAARYKRETPEYVEPLRNPVGVKHEARRRNPLIFAVVGLALSGVILWNVVQRSIVTEEPPPPLPAPAAADVAATPAVAKGPIALGTALAAPAEQTLPTPYQTPGLGAPGAIGPTAVLPAGGKQAVVTPSVGGASAIVTAIYTASPTLVSRAAVFGAPEGSSAVVLQAHKAASLILRGAGGAVYFARQLKIGEAYRAPMGQGLTAEVSDPSAFDIYIGGENKGSLSSAQTPVDKLIPHPGA